MINCSQLSSFPWAFAPGSFGAIRRHPQCFAEVALLGERQLAREVEAALAGEAESPRAVGEQGFHGAFQGPLKSPGEGWQGGVRFVCAQGRHGRWRGFALLSSNARRRLPGKLSCLGARGVQVDEGWGRRGIRRCPSCCGRCRVTLYGDGRGVFCPARAGGRGGCPHRIGVCQRGGRQTHGEARRGIEVWRRGRGRSGGGCEHQSVAEERGEEGDEQPGLALRPRPCISRRPRRLGHRRRRGSIRAGRRVGIAGGGRSTPGSRNARL